MSASPADHTPGHTPGRTPNGNGPPAKIRIPKPVDPLMRPKPRKAAPPPAIPSKPNVQVNGAGTQKKTLGKPVAGAPPKPEAGRKTAPSRYDLHTSAIIDHSDEPALSLFTAGASANTRDYKLILKPQSPNEGLRYHVARFASKNPVDVTNENEFTRPIRLHRRDPRAPALGAPKEELDSKDAAAEEEREKQELLKQQRQAQRELDMAEVAPSANPQANKRAGAKKRNDQIFRREQTEEQQARTRIKYEEALPWHLEDFDNKQAWVGSYEAALSETYAQITVKDGKFYITPLEKWYKFTPKRKFKSEDEIREELLKKQKRSQNPGFLLKHRERIKEEQEEAKAAKRQKGLYAVPAPATASSGASGPKIKKEDDEEGLDFDEGEADDEGDPLFDGDPEEAKEIEDRIKRDQRNANAFDLRDQKIYDRQEMIEKLNKAAEKQDGRKVRRALQKREKNYIYDSDSDRPFSDDESATESSEDSKNKDEKAESVEQAGKGAQPPSGTSTKGNNTPSHRPGKHSDPKKQTLLAASIKRPGSPNVSELSGNESAAKKRKKTHKPGKASLLGTGASTPNGPPSRSRTPVNGPTSAPPPTGSQSSVSGATSLKRPRAGDAGSGSEAERAGSGADSDGTRKRLKLKFGGGSKNQSPTGSRAGSPDRGPQPAATTAAAPPRAASPRPVSPPVPARPTSPPQAAAGPAKPLPSATEVRAAIPAAGISMKALLAKLGIGMGSLSQEDRTPFLTMVKQVSKYDSGTKLLRPA